jgi:hypothetical protein
MSGYEDIIRCIERWHLQAGYTDVERQADAGDVFTLLTRHGGLSESERLHAWYLDSLHAALKSSDRLVALRALVEASAYREACQTRGQLLTASEHDAFLAAHNRVEELMGR